ncbi:hypothetical protein [Dyadobacter sandarakinus]|uniref:Lipocalin-like domain-containing protein n=1 Tax=Dyadobacter sandarakinus TaxID=2747268 RepID=A0ABX7I4N9_9BACT|nr:hypothetical protein [Dyadobacter sandarakinus]QRR00532.1 hypothetical protein HWI92_06220 [Dyadobacter sandarakinus]
MKRIVCIKWKGVLMLVIGALCVSRCNVPVAMQERALEGAWQTDSIQNIVNGFSYTNNSFDEHWSTFEYHADGVLTERKKDKFRNYRYQLPAKDSLVYTDSLGNHMSAFRILRLDSRQLVLKKAQKPYLPGKNQVLFEVRFFSRINKEK